MKARLLQLLTAIGDTFWLLPGAMVVGGILLGVWLVSVDRSGFVSQAMIDSPFVYSGGGTGARTLLGAVASSTIGVAGTVFSITIAALSLAAGQMGPRLLRNFVRDRGNQFTLGALLGTFSYTLMVLRTVRTRDEGDFVPHLSLSVGILLTFLCVGVLVFFVGHMAGRINVDTVIELVSGDVRRAIRRLMLEAPQAVPVMNWSRAAPVTDPRRGYLQQLDAEGLGRWAAEHRTSVRLLIRPGGCVFPGAPIAFVCPPVEGAEEAVREAIAVSAGQASEVDLEFAVRQLVEVGVRALSPGINDPHTAMSVLDRLGVALCDAVPLHFASGAVVHGGRVALVVPAIDYGGLTDAMFHMLRQNAAGSTAVLAHMLDVLTAVAGCERAVPRQAELQRHADLALAAAERDIRTTADLNDVRDRHRRFTAVRLHGAEALLPSIANA